MKQKLTVSLSFLLFFSCLLFVGCSNDKDIPADTSEQSETKNVPEPESNDNNNIENQGNEAVEVDENNCPHPYTIEECNAFHEYYAEGDGVLEPSNQEETHTNNVDASTDSQDLNGALESSRNVIRKIHEQAVNLELAFDSPMVLEQLPNGDYHIISSFTRTNVVNFQQRYYEYEMLLDSNYNFVDLYVPGWKGPYSQPVQFR